MFPLINLSPNDYRFGRWRSRTLDFANMFSEGNNLLSSGYDLISDYPLSSHIKRKYSYFASRKSKALYNCSNHLSFRLGSDNLLRLEFANFCRDRLCLLCNWRRRLKYSFKLYSAVYSLRNDYNLIFITFTAPNVHIKDLRLAISKLHLAFNYLFGLGSRVTKSLRNSGLIGIPNYLKGSFRTVECTRRFTNFTGSPLNFNDKYFYKDKSKPPYCFDYHPHLHSVLVVDKSYPFIPQNKFGTDDKFNWVSLWTKALIKAGYPCNLDLLEKGYKYNLPEFSAGCRMNLINKDDSEDIQIKKSIYECSKYGFDTTKFQYDHDIYLFDRYIQSGHLIEFARQIYRQKLLITNGILKGCVSQDNDNENLISLKNSSSELTGKRVNFSFNKNVRYYLLSSKDDYNKPLSFATTNHEGINPFEFV